MLKFKVGDRVQTILGIGVVKEVDSDVRAGLPYQITYETGECKGIDQWGGSDTAREAPSFPYYGNSILEMMDASFEAFIDYSTQAKPKQTTMTKITNMFKTLLDSDTQTLVAAGYLDSNLEITSVGFDALNTILFVANKAALVAAAIEKIVEDTKK